MQHKDTVTTELVCALSNGASFTDLGGPLTTPNHPTFTFYNAFHIFGTGGVRHFKFVNWFAIECPNLSVTNRPLKGRGQSHVTNFGILNSMKYLRND